MHRLLIFVALSIAGLNVSAVDIEHGKELHDANCMRCHESGVYTREDRIVNSYDELHRRVRDCEIMAEMAWFEEEIDDVVAYLNKAFYKFDMEK